MWWFHTVCLFGSYARGNYEDDSDVDIMVLLNKNEFERYSDELVDLIVELTGKYSVLPSIMVEFEKEYRENIDVQSLYRNIENEGIELYNSDQRRNFPTLERYINSNFWEDIFVSKEKSWILYIGKVLMMNALIKKYRLILIFALENRV